MRVSRFALCSLGVATALRPQTSSFARRARCELLVQLERRRPALEAAGVGLVAVGIGTPEKGRLVADRAATTASRLLADPENALYDALALNAGVGRTFFNPATPYAILDRLQSGTGGDLGDVLGKWLPGGGPSGEGAFIIPPKQAQAFNQGGMFVFADGASRFVHYDA
ncbi:prostaglandin-F synthase [Aureococcus anophagefferens]|nr:prostaglandin-F synthase [Aureococcus anophagefferens]